MWSGDHLCCLARLFYKSTEWPETLGCPGGTTPGPPPPSLPTCSLLPFLDCHAVYDGASPSPCCQHLCLRAPRNYPWLTPLPVPSSSFLLPLHLCMVETDPCPGPAHHRPLLCHHDLASSGVPARPVGLLSTCFIILPCEHL